MALISLFIGVISGVRLQSPCRAGEIFRSATRIELDDKSWKINGELTYKGSWAEGLLLNVSMVNSTFEDRNPKTRPPGFDPDKNTEKFIARIPEYVSHGVLAFTLNLQGGSPGYSGALNSAFEPDGELRPQSLKRVERVVEACDRAGAGVILGCFHHEQDQVLEDAAAVMRAVAATASWIKKKRYTNVLLEIANEYPGPDFDHEVIQSIDGIRPLILLARQTPPGLLVSASGTGNGRSNHLVGMEADFILIHLDRVEEDDILRRVAAADKISKAIVCNRDARTGEEGASALEATVNALASWGYSNLKQNQHHPFKFEGVADDPVVYAKLKELTTPAR